MISHKPPSSVWVVGTHTIGNDMDRPWDDTVRETKEHMLDPQFGDRFHDNYSFWVHVIGRHGDDVFYREYSAGPDCIPIGQAPVTRSSLGEFQQRFKGGDGYWIIFDSHIPEKFTQLGEVECHGPGCGFD